jgi:Uncharacterized conserved protein (DUF2190)
MSTQYFGTGSFLANATITAFRAVVISTNGGVGLAASTGSVDGIAQIDAASGDYVTVKFLNNAGTQKGTLVTGPVTVGDTLYLGASGQVSPTGTVTVGKSLTTAGTDGSIIEFIAKNL